MELIEIQTLVDITPTGVTRLNQGTQFQLDQNRNFITLTQCVELRSIVHYDKGPTSEKIDIKGLGFGTEYKGKQMVWTFRFQTDRLGVYLDDTGNILGYLLSDLHQVPVIKNLNETINIDKSIFDLKNDLCRNTVVRSLNGVT